MAEKPKWFQKLFYKETVLAIKSSLDFLHFENFKNDLLLLLPQESKKSRIRIANNILHRFFPEKKTYNFLSQVWEVYQDEKLLQEIIRYELLSQEPVIANFFILHIFPKKIKEKFLPQIFDDYIKETYDKEIKNLVWWLQSTIRDLGFISKSNNLWQINDTGMSETAFILLLHKILAPYPAQIEINTVMQHNFWKLIGIKNPEILNNILYKAYLLNLIEMKDNIIKTKYPIESLYTVLKHNL